MCAIVILPKECHFLPKVCNNLLSVQYSAESDHILPKVCNILLSVQYSAKNGHILLHSHQCPKQREWGHETIQ